MQIVWSLLFWRRVGDICHPVFYYADPFLGVYGVRTTRSNRLVSSLPHAYFRESGLPYPSQAMGRNHTYRPMSIEFVEHTSVGSLYATVQTYPTRPFQALKLAQDYSSIS
jgi:hypothetical protein